MDGATINSSRKTANDKVFLILGQKGHFFTKNVIALNLYIGTNVLVYERRLMVKVWSAKIATFSFKITQLKIYFCA